MSSSGPSANRNRNRIDQLFRTYRAREQAALIVYLTVGDPSVEETVALVETVERAGADLIELGVPFSDPSADGPAIQRAMERALRAGDVAAHALESALLVVERIRAKSEIPLVLFGYYNPLLQYGLERLAARAAAAGVDGVLVVDLPPEEASPLAAALEHHQLKRIPLLAPTSSLERAREIVRTGGGFAYYVGLTGVTGAGHLDVGEVYARLNLLAPALGELPVAVGFGIKDAARAREVAEIADAVVVGSALVERIASARSAPERLAQAAALTTELKRAIESTTGSVSASRRARKVR